MILAADAEGCVREVLVLAAALSIPDPRERPADREEAARQKHARFADEHSDFVSYLNLWRYLREQRKERSGNAFRRMCREEFLHYLRIREWQDLTGQLRSIARDIGIHESLTTEPADPASVHAALTAGLLSHVGLREGDTREYTGRAQLEVRPGARLGAHQAAAALDRRRRSRRDQQALRPDRGAHRAGGGRARRGRSRAAHLQRAALGCPPRRGDGLRTGDAVRPAARGRAAASGTRGSTRRLARELFIRHALVEGDWQTRHHFFRDNARLREELAEIEERARRRDLLVGDDEIYAFYDARIPADVVSARHFDAWWKKQRHQTPDLLTFTRDDLLRTEDVRRRPAGHLAGRTTCRCR